MDEININGLSSEELQSLKNSSREKMTIDQPQKSKLKLVYEGFFWGLQFLIFSPAIAIYWILIRPITMSLKLHIEALGSMSYVAKIIMIHVLLMTVVLFFAVNYFWEMFHG